MISSSKRARSFHISRIHGEFGGILRGCCKVYRDPEPALSIVCRISLVCAGHSLCRGACACSDFTGAPCQSASIVVRYIPMYELSPIWNQRADLQVPRLPQRDSATSDCKSWLSRSAGNEKPEQ